MAMFHEELKYFFHRLFDAQSVVMTSFLSQKTVSYLDLQLSERPLPDYGLLPFEYFSFERKLFCTEESLRNCLVPERRLLYTLSLDVPHGREYSNLMNGPVPDNFPFNIESIFVAFGCTDFFYREVLSQLLEAAFKRTDCKLKLLKWMLDFRPLESVYIPENVQYPSAKFLYYESEDVEFVRAFLRKFIKINYLLDIEELEVLEYLLHQSRLCDFKPISIPDCCCLSLTDYIIERRYYRLVDIFLKYEATANYIDGPQIVCRHMLKEYGCWIENQMDAFKIRRMCQIIKIYIDQKYNQVHQLTNSSSSAQDNHRNQEASQALWLVWNSIPDSFFSLQEMMDACRNRYPTKVISDAHLFYEEAIHQTVSCRKPRSLSHYCRTVLRQQLYTAKLWLPDGIHQLNLTTIVESFLNLQRDNLCPDKFQADLTK